MKTPLIVDVETVGTALTGRVVTLAWKQVGEASTHVLAVGHTERQDPYPSDLLEMMADPERPFVSFTKYDARFLKLQGIEVTGPYYDIQVMCWVYNENQPLSLAATVRRYLGREMDKRIKVRNGAVMFQCDDEALVPIDVAPLDQLYRYNADDTTCEADLFEDMWERLYDAGWLDYFLAEEVPFTETLVDVECRGLPVDLGRTVAFAEELEVRHADMLDGLYQGAGLPPTFNMNSNDQMAAYLYNKTFELVDSLEWGVVECECLKSCLADKHDDCWIDPIDIPAAPIIEPGELAIRLPVHITDLLPIGFEVDKVGRSLIHGRWTLKGRGLKPTEKTDGGKWSVSRPVLKTNYNTAKDPWIQGLLEYRSVDKLLTTYLRRWPEQAVNEWGETYGSAQRRVASGQTETNRAQDTSGYLLANESTGTSLREQEGQSLSPSLDSGKEIGSVPVPSGTSEVAGGSSTPSRRKPVEQRPGEYRSSPEDVARRRSLLRPDESELGTFRIYGRFQQTGTKTGRLSSSEPNLQNIPSHGDLGPRVRDLFRV